MNISPVSGQDLDTTLASYEEGLLSDALLKCIGNNKMTTFFKRGLPPFVYMHVGDPNRDADLGVSWCNVSSFACR